MKTKLAVTDMDTPAMTAIPPGEFLMGATDDDKYGNLLERPRHRVVIRRGFALGTFPVTFAEWDCYADAITSAHRPAGPEPGSEHGRLPVSGVSWLDAIGYCAWLRDRTGRPYRLPTEAEWEYACRAGTRSVFSFGDAAATDQCNYLYDELGRPIGVGGPTPVGSYPPNAFGLHDMHGNVNELVQDGWHDGYDGAPADGAPWLDPPDASNPYRVIRGGSWDYLPRLLRAAYRDWIREDHRLDHVGFRVAMDLDAA